MRAEGLTVSEGDVVNEALAHCHRCNRIVDTSHSPVECDRLRWLPRITTGPLATSAGVATPDPFRAARVITVPNKPKTPQRSFRIPDDVYEAAKVKAAAKGETVTDVVVRALKRYGKKS